MLPDESAVAYEWVYYSSCSIAMVESVAVVDSVATVESDTMVGVVVEHHHHDHPQSLDF